MKRLRIGSRESTLAVAQAQLLMEAICTHTPSLVLELVTMKTTGDKILDRPLDQVGGKGLFVRELDIALREGWVDLTVHSLKDLPMETDPRLPLVAFSHREDPRDALILPAGVETLDLTGTVGCSSRRRALQLRQLYPGITVVPVRGNVLTRLEKLDAMQFSALVLAAAGLKRLGLHGRVSRYFTPEEMLPAAGQGILAVQARLGEEFPCLSGFHDATAAACATAERAFVRSLDGGCSSPIAAYAVLEVDTLLLTGMDGAGHRASISGVGTQAATLGEALAAKMKGEG